jgi:hypothetical protein
MLHDRGQRHGKRFGELANRQAILRDEPRQHGAAGRVGQGRKSAVERVVLILNHDVKYKRKRAGVKPARCAKSGNRPQ